MQQAGQKPTRPVIKAIAPTAMRTYPKDSSRNICQPTIASDAPPTTLKIRCHPVTFLVLQSTAFSSVIAEMAFSGD